MSSATHGQDSRQKRRLLLRLGADEHGQEAPAPTDHQVHMGAAHCAAANPWPRNPAAALSAPKQVKAVIPQESNPTRDATVLVAATGYSESEQVGSSSTVHPSRVSPLWQRGLRGSARGTELTRSHAPRFPLHAIRKKSGDLFLVA